VGNVPTISNPSLTVLAVAGHPGQRRLRVVYVIGCDPADPAAGHPVAEHIAIHAVDEHDAAVRPRQTPILELDDTFVVAAGTHPRSVEHVINRVDLDVEQDWWASDDGGEPQPIAEWLDHVAADIRLEFVGAVTIDVTTPTVTGSWGALGHD
jgi:hypothetical protein